MSGGAVVVAGGLGAIGGALTRRLMEQGSDVLALGSRRRDDRAVQARLTEVGGPQYIQCDVTDDWRVHRVAQDAGPIRAGVYCAGKSYPVPALAMAPDDFTRMFAVNALGAYVFGAAVGKRMIAQGKGGALVYVGSWAAETPEVTDLGYGATKAAGAAIMQGLAVEFAEHSIRVNTLAVGVVGGEGMAARHLEADPSGYGDRVSKMPLGRFATVDEVARGLEFLISYDWSSYITGATLRLDGGASLRRS